MGKYVLGVLCKYIYHNMRFFPLYAVLTHFTTTGISISLSAIHIVSYSGKTMYYTTIRTMMMRSFSLTVISINSNLMIQKQYVKHSLQF